MARWNLEAALEVLAWLRRTDLGKAAELEARLNLTSEQLERWVDIIYKPPGGRRIVPPPEGFSFP